MVISLAAELHHTIVYNIFIVIFIGIDTTINVARNTLFLVTLDIAVNR